jgi:hypothetical protein
MRISAKKLSRVSKNLLVARESSPNGRSKSVERVKSKEKARPRVKLMAKNPWRRSLYWNKSQCNTSITIKMTTYAACVLTILYEQYVHPAAIVTARHASLSICFSSMYKLLDSGMH